MMRAGAICLIAMLATPAFAADSALIDAAKKEGKVVWYTTAIIDQFVRPMVTAFESKYDVKVEYARSNTADLELRVSSEARAGKMLADFIDGTTSSITLKKLGLVEKWTPATKLDARHVDPDGYWMACNEYVLAPARNTELVPDKTSPRTWEDLLDPKWRGKMVWNSVPASSAGQGFIGTVIMEWGEARARDYFAKLATQNIAGMKAAARQVLDTVIAGEYAIALQMFNNQSTISAAKGAPVDWIVMEPALAVVSPCSITAGAPHPNAARLLFDFIMSDEGQAIIAKAGELPVAPNIPPLDPRLRPDTGKFRAHYIDPAKLQASIAAWTQIYDEYFR